MRKVLLVEDDDAIRGCISEGLGMAGYKVFAVATSSAALNELEGDQSFDVAVIDVKMPRGHPHGFALGRMARLEWPDLRLVFMSGDAGVAEADGGAPLGPVLLKPVRVSDLIAAIEAELAMKRG